MPEQITHSEVDQRLDLSHLTRGEFITAIAHLYRGELSEATAWRSRIDTTSNWAVVLSVSSLSFVFADKSGDRHVLIPIVTLFCTFLMFMEARRYRFYDIWRTRVRILESNFYRPMLEGGPPASPDWAETLANDLSRPHFHMPWWEAVGRRLRRNYQWIYAVLLASWLIVLMAHPTPTTSWEEVVSRAALGPLPGQIVMATMLIFYGGLFALGAFSFYESRYTKRLPAGHPDRLRAERKPHE
jgi:uncharacterized membrane protein